MWNGEGVKNVFDTCIAAGIVGAPVVKQKKKQCALQ